jgi:hypothetical protein
MPPAGRVQRGIGPDGAEQTREDRPEARPTQRAYAGQQRYRDCLMRLLNRINVFGGEY